MPYYSAEWIPIPSLPSLYLTVIPQNSVFSLQRVQNQTFMGHFPEEPTWTMDVLIRTITEAVPIVQNVSTTLSTCIVKLNGDYFLYKDGIYYKIRSIVHHTYDNSSINLIERFILCSPAELPSNVVPYICTISDMQGVYVNREYAECGNEIIIGYSNNRTESSLEINNINERYSPTEQELIYPEAYVRNHKFNCKSSEPMIVGDWAVNFNTLICKKLTKLGF